MKFSDSTIVSLFAGAAALLITSATTAQSNADLLKLHDSLNDMCRDGAGNKTGQACDSRELVGQMLRAKNICFGELGKVIQCQLVVSAPEAGEVVPPAADQSQSEPCQKFAENEIIEAKGFLVEFDYAAEETAPARVRAVV